MADEIRHPDGRIEHPTVRYERSDASLTGVLIIMASALVFGILIHVIVWVFFVNYDRRLEAERRSTYPLAPAPRTKLPPEPRLEQLDRTEGSDAADVYARQKAKLDALRTYGKTDEAGFVHVPIDAALRHLADRLPVRKAQPADPRHDLGLVDSGEPNSGRLFRKEPR